MTGFPIRKDQFLAYWLFWSAAVWAAAVIVTVPGAIILLMCIGNFVSAGILGSVMMGMYIGGVVGLVAGFLQHRLMKHYFFVHDSGWWRRSAVAGIPAGLMIATGNDALMHVAQLWYCNGATYCYGMYNEGVFVTLTHILPMTVFIGIISLAQWSVLRRYVDDAWLWVLANVAGGLVFGVIFHGQDALSGWLCATLAQGAVTGATLLWLFLHRAQPLESAATASGSVWDQAI